MEPSIDREDLTIDSKDLLYNLAYGCANLFSRLENKLQESQENLVIIQYCIDFQQRFAIWVERLGVLAPEDRCLDTRLQNHLDLRDLSFRLLDILLHSLEQWDIKATDKGGENLTSDSTIQVVDETLSRLNSLGVNILQSTSTNLSSWTSQFTYQDDSNYFKLLSARAIQSLYPHAHHSLKEYLVKTMADRYERIVFEKSRHAKAKPRQERLETIMETEHDDFKQSLSLRPKRKALTNTTHPATRASQSDRPKWDSEVARNRKQPLDQPSAEQPRKTTSIQIKQSRYPERPPADGNSNISLCEWCSEPIDSSMLEREWRQHVDNDLKPYVCLSPECTDNDRQYPTLDEWLKHMEIHGQMWHTKLYRPSDWFCVFCFPSRTTYRGPRELYAHLDNLHSNGLTEAQLEAISRQSKQNHPRCWNECLICGYTVEGEDPGLCAVPNASSRTTQPRKRNRTEISSQMESSPNQIPAPASDIFSDIGGSNCTQDDYQPTQEDLKFILRHIALHLQGLMNLTIRLAASHAQDHPDSENETMKVSVETDDTNSFSETSDLGRLSDFCSEREDEADSVGRKSDDVDPIFQSDIEDLEDDDNVISLDDIRTRQAEPCGETDEFLTKAVESGAFQSWRDVPDEPDELASQPLSPIDPGQQKTDGTSTTISSQGPNQEQKQRVAGTESHGIMEPGALNILSSSNDPHMRKRAFGLDNPDRVERILDHGQWLCHRDNTKARKIQSLGDVPDLEDFLSAIVKDLNNSMKKYFLDNNRYYIQRSDFERILTPEKVLQVVNKLPCYKSKTREENRKLAEEICFGTKSKPPCIKVFGALLMSDQIQDIEIHRADGLNDHCLPLIFSEEGFRLSCDRHKEGHAWFNKKKPEFRKRFSDAARTLVAPYIKWEDGKHFHYVIRGGSCLPIYDHKKIDKKIQTEGAQAVPDATSGADGGYGGFSEVYRVKISESHYDHSDTKGRHHRGYFALKKLTPRYTERESFNLELSTLIYSADQKGNKDHLIKLLATFEEHNSAQGQDCPTYYLLFDWAEGDLARYWQENERFVGDPKHCVWMSDQFCGLAEGLQIIHNDREKNLKFLPADVSDPNVYGRHGDIKPGNILYFETGKSEAPEQSLVLADFGLGRLQTKYSRSKQDPQSLARTETYRSPEFDLPPPKGMVSPASDIFSLGCVFLEYISWYILGTKAVVEDFTNIMRIAYDIDFDEDRTETQEPLQQPLRERTDPPAIAPELPDTGLQEPEAPLALAPATGPQEPKVPLRERTDSLSIAPELPDTGLQEPEAPLALAPATGPQEPKAPLREHTDSLSIAPELPDTELQEPDAPLALAPATGPQEPKAPLQQPLKERTDLLSIAPELPDTGLQEPEAPLALAPATGPDQPKTPPATAHQPSEPKPNSEPIGDPMGLPPKWAQASAFFNVTTEPDGKQDAELKTSVKEWIQKLKKHRFCNDYINQMLDVIQDHMLDPNPKTRWRSMQLVRELQAMKLACQREPSFYTKNSNSSN